MTCKLRQHLSYTRLGYLALLVVPMSLGSLRAQTMVDLKRQARDVDFSTAQTTKPVRTGTTLPTNCGVGEMFFNTNSPGGSSVYSCATANTWTPIGSGAGLGDPGSNGILTRTGFDTTAAVGAAGAPLNAQNIEQAFYADQFANVQAAVSAAGASGIVIIPAAYAGTDTWTNASGVQVMDYRTNAQQTFNARSWGCKGDGVHDDTACLTNFFNFLNGQTMGVAYFPSGKYLMNGTLYNTSSITIRGDGREASFLVETNPTADLLNIKSGTRTNTQWDAGSSIDNISFGGQGSATTGNLLVMTHSGVLDQVGFFGTGGRGLLLLSERVFTRDLHFSYVRQAIVTAANVGINESYFHNTVAMTTGCTVDDLGTSGHSNAYNYNINSVNGVFPASGAIQADPHTAIEFGANSVNIQLTGGSIKPTQNCIGGIKFKAATAASVQNFYIEGFTAPDVNPSLIYGGNHEKVVLSNAISTAQTVLDVVDGKWMSPFVSNSGDLPVEGTTQITLPHFVIRPPDYVYGSTAASSLGGGITQGSFEYVKWQGVVHDGSGSGWHVYVSSSGRAQNSTTALAWPAGAILEETWGDPNNGTTASATPIRLVDNHFYSYGGYPSSYTLTCDATSEKACGEIALGFEPDAYYKWQTNNYPLNPHWTLEFFGSNATQTGSDGNVGKIDTFGPVGVDFRGQYGTGFASFPLPTSPSSNASIPAAAFGGSTIVRELMGGAYPGDLFYTDSTAAWHLWGTNQYQGYGLNSNVTGINTAGLQPGNTGFSILHTFPAANGAPYAYTLFDWQGFHTYNSSAGSAYSKVFDVSLLSPTSARAFATSMTNAVNTLTFSATPNFDLSLGDQTITLTGNVTSSTVSNLVAGQKIAFRICQDATGGRTFVWPGSVHGAMTIGSTAATCNVQQFESFDGAILNAISAGVTNQ